MKPQYVPREKGSPVLLTKTRNRLRLLGSYFQLQRKRANIEEYLEFIQTTARRMYAPLQVSSEILSLMKLVASEKPKSILEIGTANESLQQVKSLLNGRNLDFLLIDGDHTKVKFEPPNVSRLLLEKNRIRYEPIA